MALDNPRELRHALETSTLDAATALGRLLPIAQGAPVRAARVEAYGLIGEIAGRAFDAHWEVAERAAWMLLNLARYADGIAERRGLILAIGRGFRNLWLMPFVHARLDDERPEIVEVAITAAGGLGFGALELVVASRFLAPDVDPELRRTAVAALGRMGAWTAAPRLVPLIDGDSADAAAALTALTEIRSDVGAAAAAALLERDPPREVLVAAMRYLAELGHAAVPPVLRRLGRHDDPEMRAVSALCARAFKAALERDAGDRLLIALTERDRAVRALLARRLRTLPADEVLAQAETLLGDDPEGVVQILGELRSPEVVRFLFALSSRDGLPANVRARALGAIVAAEPWAREGLAKVIAESKEDALRAAAAQALGSFASLEEVLQLPLSDDASPLLRGAAVWAMQLAARPATMPKEMQSRCERGLKRALGDPDPFVRRRAAYVSGNLRLSSLAPDLVALAKAEEERADLRVAAFTGLGELAAPAALEALVGLFKREEDAAALVAASRAIVATVEQNADVRVDLSRVQGRLQHLLKAEDPAVREAAVALAGLAGGVVSASALLPLAAPSAQGVAPHVREAALSALGKMGAGSAEAEALLLGALEDPDPAIHERAADALLALGGRRPLERLLEYTYGEDDGELRARVAARLELPAVEKAHFLPLVNAALARLEAGDPAYEPMVRLKLKLLDEGGAAAGAAGAGVSVDAAITALFPMYAQLSTVRGFDSLNRSLRTAESLYRSAATLAEADHSAPMMLWMKCLEGYVHAWLTPRLTTLQRQPMDLCNRVDQILGDAWPVYQRHLQDRWPDPVEVGTTRVEVPLRAAPNALRDFQERRMRRLDSPLSVTEWSRMMLFFAVDHPSGVKNVFKVSSRNPDHVVRVAHRLQTLAAVRNLVTHRAAAGAATLEAFRRAYYTTFEELTRLA
jgi:HEAT repeat protein